MEETMSIWTDITHAPDHAIEFINDTIDRWTGNDREKNQREGADEYGFYFGTNTGFQPIYNPGQGYTYNTIPKPAAYSRTSAKTANDIAQGGMTKQEVQEFNMKHPNETAQRGQ